MNTQRSILLAACLSLAGCADSFSRTPVGGASGSSAQVRVHVVEAAGGGWGAIAQARAAMDSLAGVDRILMCGTRATLVLKAGAELAEAQVRTALEANGLKFESLEERRIDRPGAAYVAKTPALTWAGTAQKVRAAFLKDMVGVQDVFCGPETIVHMKSSSAAVAPEVIAAALAKLEVVCDEVRRDDAAMF